MVFNDFSARELVSAISASQVPTAMPCPIDGLPVCFFFRSPLEFQPMCDINKTMQSGPITKTEGTAS